MDVDFALLDEFTAGNERAFTKLVRKYQEQIYYLVLRMVHDHDDATDIAQSVFISAFRNLTGFQRKSSFKTWIYRIAINLAKNYIRDTGKWKNVYLEDVALKSSSNPISEIIFDEQNKELWEAVETLPEKQRMTLMLRVHDGLSHKEIGQILNCTETNAKVNYHHAVSSLKEKLKDNSEVLK